jgi:hypothetical protein
MCTVLRALLLAGLLAAPPALADEAECRLQLPPGIHRQSMFVGGRERHFLAVVPSGTRVEGRLVPAMLDWHGFSESPYYQEKLVGLQVCPRAALRDATAGATGRAQFLIIYLAGGHSAVLLGRRAALRLGHPSHRVVLRARLHGGVLRARRFAGQHQPLLAQRWRLLRSLCRRRRGRPAFCARHRRLAGRDALCRPRPGPSTTRLEITRPRFGSLNGKRQSFMEGRFGRFQTHRPPTKIAQAQIVGQL